MPDVQQEVEPRAPTTGGKSALLLSAGELTQSPWLFGLLLYFFAAGLDATREVVWHALQRGDYEAVAYQVFTVASVTLVAAVARLVIWRLWPPD